LALTNSEQEPLVCVVVTVYNVAEYLGKCLESVTQQTVRNLEIIVVDDASTDNFAEVMAQWEAKDKRIRSLRLPLGTVGGAGQPTNRGIESCSPESKV
jgi:glycosyltransferase involved in cell wall biosynthesis